jgi:hypothetical protein
VLQDLPLLREQFLHMALNRALSAKASMWRRGGSGAGMLEFWIANGKLAWDDQNYPSHKGTHVCGSRPDLHASECVPRVPRVPQSFDAVRAL